MKKLTDYQLRRITTSDQPFLWEMLYQALYFPPGVTPSSREIVYTPKLSKYVCDWGKADDLGLLALSLKNDYQPIGAVWLRLFKNDCTVNFLEGR